MEVPYSASLGAMGSLLRKLDGLLRITQAGPLKESIWRLLNMCRIRNDLVTLSEVHDLSLTSKNLLVEERFNAYKLGKLDELLCAEDSTPSFYQLRDSVASISVKLGKLSDSDVNRPSGRASYWMKDVRELSYDIEDFVDQFFFIHDDSADAATHWIDKISGFVARVKEVGERYDRYNLGYVFRDPTITTVSHHLRGLRPEETEIFHPIGMEEPTNELIELMKWKDDGEDYQQLRVISILGAEGVGKTTLARRLWRHMEEKFDCRAFVQASKKPDLRMILRSILSQVRPKQSPGAFEVTNLIQELRTYLQDKRYFIIIDDIWAVSVWDVINCAFPENKYCSRILTTTTVEDIALACCGYEPEYLFEMKTLNDCQSQQLFVDRAFGSGNGCPPEFRNVTEEIIRKCGGLPLAIIWIATLIANQPQPEIAHKLEYMQSVLRHNLRTNTTSMEIMKQALSLCYSYLPDCLKTCLLYLSVYPENYSIQKDDLMKQWIAEDFICITESKDIVEVASSYFDELVGFGLIQGMDTNGKKGFYYAVHPVVFDFITCKSIEDNFISIIDYSQSTVALLDKVRRLCLHFGSATYATAPASAGLSQVRSLVFMGVLNCMPSLVEFKLVRVAIFHLQVDDRDASFPIKGICRLLLLRYLQVKCNVAVELPDQMGCLKHLETLEILARVAAVPSDFVHLPRLLHLRLGRERYRRHRCLSLRYLSPLENLSLDCSSRTTRPIPIFGFPPFICMITRPPQWIAPFGNLTYLDVGVREHCYDVAAGLVMLKAARNIISPNTHQITMSKVHNHVFSASATQRIAPFRNLSYLDADVRERRHDVDAISGKSKTARNITRLNTHHHTMSGSKKIVIKVDMVDKKSKSVMLPIVCKLEGIESLVYDGEKGMLVVTGTVDAVRFVQRIRKKGFMASIFSVEDKPKEKDRCKEMGGSKDKCDKECKAWYGVSCSCSRCKQSSASCCCYVPGAGGGASCFDPSAYYPCYGYGESSPDSCTIQ